ncbi:DEKNAAC104132 [Brettanomyces naardenensis]|uniref:RNA exonuclease 3 n=1 Tax=Brettanomyces naardenensis TaxID=13370 RepID=A0A448YPZ5_BRENA|nr:DEKNAAC104132 [Brettanomyces naardenensis]
MPAKRRNDFDDVPAKKIKHAKLLPIPVLPYAPVRQDERQHYLKLLHKEYAKGIDDNSIAISRAVEEEYEICKKSKSRMEYTNVVKKSMYKLMKARKIGDDRRREKAVNDQRDVPTTSTAQRKISPSPHPSLPASSASSASSASLPAPSTPLPAPPTPPPSLYSQLSKLCVPKELLIKHKFVMDLPEVVKPDDIEECIRCHTKFLRSEQFDTKNHRTTVCKFHPGKMLLETNSNIIGGGQRRVRNREYSNRYYTCCHELQGESEGCKELPSHVFKPEDPGILHWFKRFRTIEGLRKTLDIRDDEKSQIERKRRIRAIGIDCEMCFTNLGFELMKVSAIDFDTMKPILDNLVIPDGEIVVDLNSQVSGVYSVPKEGDPGTLTFDEVMVRLAELTDRDTIVIGHGLENDLNVLRLIYPRIVDTAVLFSENQIDPMRKDPLKKLAWKYLSKNIQQSEHDPMEDAEIPVEIVKRVLMNANLRKQRVSR